MEGIEVATFSPISVKLPSVPKHGEECLQCDGSGHQHTCPDCECPCEECDGTGHELPEIKTSTIIRGVTFGLDTWFNALPPLVSYLSLLDFAGKYQTQCGGQFDAMASSKSAIYFCAGAVGKGLENTFGLAGTMNSAYVPFNYGMNSKATDGLPSDYLKSSMIRNTSALVLFSDERTRTDETPYAAPGTSYAGEICTPQSYTTRLSGRHGAGANLTFADGHSAWFKYNYAITPVNGNNGLKPGDPGHSDIVWTYDGHAVP